MKSTWGAEDDDDMCCIDDKDDFAVRASEKLKSVSDLNKVRNFLFIGVLNIDFWLGNEVVAFFFPNRASIL